MAEIGLRLVPGAHGPGIGRSRLASLARSQAPIEPVVRSSSDQLLAKRPRHNQPAWGSRRGFLEDKARWRDKGPDGWRLFWVWGAGERLLDGPGHGPDSWKRACPSVRVVNAGPSGFTIVGRAQTALKRAPSIPTWWCRSSTRTTYSIFATRCGRSSNGTAGRKHGLHSHHSLRDPQKHGQIAC